MFNNYFNDYMALTSILKGTLRPKLTMLDIKFHGAKNSHHHVRKFISPMSLKGIDKDTFHLIFRWTFDKS